MPCCELELLLCCVFFQHAQALESLMNRSLWSESLCKEGACFGLMEGFKALTRL